jgi:hypothetical protein
MLLNLMHKDHCVQELAGLPGRRQEEAAMTHRPTALFLALFLALPIAAMANPESTGYSDNTSIITQDGDFCPGAVLVQNDDGTVENGYAWSFGGVVPPDFGAWAECYEADYVCGIQFGLTQTGYYMGQTMDVYVWEDDGAAPPDNMPGNTLCAVLDVAPGPIALWPDVSIHDVQICCETPGRHFVGFWGNWPMQQAAWFIACDENGPPAGCPSTNIAPGIGYPTGWNRVHVVPTFDDCKALLIREYAGEGDCAPTPAESTTWGRIKALY